MPTTVINMKVKPVEEKAVTPQNNQLGNMIASSDDITAINGDPSLAANTQASWSAFAGRITGFVRPDTSCLVFPTHLFQTAVSFRPRDP